MTWDNNKNTFDSRPSVPSDEKLTASEWNNHVADQKGRVPFGPLADRPAAADADNGDVFFVTDLANDAGIMTKLVSGSWEIMGLGDASNRVPDVYAESVDTDQATINDWLDTTKADLIYSYEGHSVDSFASSSTGAFVLSAENGANPSSGARWSTGKSAGDAGEGGRRNYEYARKAMSWSNPRRWYASVHIANVKASTENAAGVGMGRLNRDNATAEKCVAFVWENGDLKGVIENGSSRSETTLISGFSNGTFDLYIEWDGSTATYFVDDPTTSDGQVTADPSGNFEDRPLYGFAHNNDGASNVRHVVTQARMVQA